MYHRNVIIKINFFLLCFLLLVSSIYTNAYNKKVFSDALSFSNVFVNEVMPDPIGSDTDFEWIELYNFGYNSIFIQGWTLNGKSIPDFEILPMQFLILARNKSKFIERYPHLEQNTVQVSMSLPNSGGNLILRNQNSVIVDEVNYSSAVEGYSFERGGPLCSILFKGNPHSVFDVNFNYNDDCYPILEVSPSVSATDTPLITNTTYPTVGATNIPTNTPSFISTITFIPTLTFIPSQNPTLTPFTFTPTPTLITEITETNTPTPSPSSTTTISSTSTPLINFGSQSSIIITEIYSSPKSGSGIKEWIEIFNQSNMYVSLKGMYFRDRSNSTNSYGNTKSFLPEIVIKPYEYLVIDNLKISLNNNGDEIWLFSSTNEIVDYVIYDKTDHTLSNIRIWDEQNESYIFDYSEYSEDNFLPQTTTITKGEKNIYTNKSTLESVTTTLTSTPTNRPTKTIVPTKLVISQISDNSRLSSSVLSLQSSLSSENSNNNSVFGTYEISDDTIKYLAGQYFVYTIDEEDIRVYSWPFYLFFIVVITFIYLILNTGLLKHGRYFIQKLVNRMGKKEEFF